MQKSQTQKIIMVISIIAASLLMIITLRFLSQNLYMINQLSAKVDKPKVMYAKLYTMIGFNALAWIMNLVYFVIKVNKDKGYIYKRLAIANSVIIGVSLILTVVFLNTEAASLTKEFLYDPTNSSSTRSLRYYFYQDRKYIHAVILSIMMIVSYFGQLVKQSKEKVVQSALYSIAIILVFINSMFLMVTMLDGLKSPSEEVSKKWVTIPGVALSALAFFVSFFHIFVGIIQRRAISDDKLNHKKIQIASYTFIGIELVLTLAVIIMLNFIFNQKKTYFVVLFSEYLQILVIGSLLVFGAIKYSADERLVTERKERLQAQSEIDNSETLKI